MDVQVWGDRRTHTQRCRHRSHSHLPPAQRAPQQHQHTALPAPCPKCRLFAPKNATARCQRGAPHPPRVAWGLPVVPISTVPRGRCGGSGLPSLHRERRAGKKGCRVKGFRGRKERGGTQPAGRPGTPPQPPGLIPRRSCGSVVTLCCEGVITGAVAAIGWLKMPR